MMAQRNGLWAGAGLAGLLGWAGLGALLEPGLPGAALAEVIRR